jgi:hypothetical protein
MTEDLHLNPYDPEDHRNVYIRELFHYECDGSGGKFEFNGYYYVEDSALPKKHSLCYRRWDVSGAIVDEQTYLVEIYRREVVKDTSVFTPTRRELEERGETTTEEDDDWGGICFFPTKRQVLYFRVLDTF